MASSSSITTEELAASERIIVPQLLYGDIDKSLCINSPPYGWCSNSYSYDTKKIRLHKLCGDIRVYSGHGIVTIDGVTILETLYYHRLPPLHEFIEQWANGRQGFGSLSTVDGNLYFTQPQPSRSTRISKAGFHSLASFSPKKNYGHFWFDHISHFAAQHEFPSSLSESCVLIPGIANPFWAETISLIADVQGFPLTIFPIHWRHEVQIDCLYFIEGITSNYVGKARPAFTDYTRKLARRAAERLPEARLMSLRGVGSRVLFSRRDSSVRANGSLDDIIEGAFSRADFKIISGSDFTIEEKLFIASNAKVLVSRFGSGSLNILFAPVGAVLAELHSPVQCPPHGRHCAAAGKQSYAAIVGQPVRTEGGGVMQDDGFIFSESAINLFAHKMAEQG
jgi:hypothetical protein